MFTRNFDLMTIHTTLPRHLTFTVKTENWGIPNGWIWFQHSRGLVPRPTAGREARPCCPFSVLILISNRRGIKCL